MPALAAKTRRQRAILDILRDEAIGSQQLLLRALKRQGFEVTQATLSRDLRELKVLRVPSESGFRYSEASDAGAAAAGSEPGPAARLRVVAAEEVTGVEANEVGVVVRTLTGRAQGVAVYIDGLRHPHVLGTIAGDDTILVLPRTVKKTPRLASDLAELFGAD